MISMKNLDNLNNSQMVLLCILISLVTGAAVAIGTLAVLVDNLATSTPQQTVIRETVNRVIERTTVAEGPRTNASEPRPGASNLLTIDFLKSIFVKVNSRNTFVESGVLISQSGRVLSTTKLSRRTLYSIVGLSEDANHKVLGTLGDYAILESNAEGISIENYVNLANAEDIELGRQVSIYGGFGDKSTFYSEVISKVTTFEGFPETFKISLGSNEIVLPSMVLIDGKLVGMLTERNGLVQVITKDLIEKEIGSIK